MPKERHRLKSKNSDLTRFQTPELRWEFYDTFHRAKITTAARLEGDSSVANLDYYVSTTQRSKPLTSSLQGFLDAADLADAKKKSPYPPPFDQLLLLQEESGRFSKLGEVLTALSLPLSYKNAIERATLWEQATAFAIASIRQRLELFDLLRDAHDRAIVHMPSNELICKARDLMLLHKLTRDYKEEMDLKVFVEEDEAESEHKRSASSIEDAISIKKTLQMKQEAEEAERAQFEAESKAVGVVTDERWAKMAQSGLVGSKAPSFFLPRPVPTTMSFCDTVLVEERPEAEEEEEDADDDDFDFASESGSRSGSKSGSRGSSRGEGARGGGGGGGGSGGRGGGISLASLGLDVASLSESEEGVEASEFFAPIPLRNGSPSTLTKQGVRFAKPPDSPSSPLAIKISTPLGTPPRNSPITFGPEEEEEEEEKEKEKEHGGEEKKREEEKEGDMDGENMEENGDDGEAGDDFLATLQKQLKNLSPTKDKARIQRTQSALDTLQVQIINQCLLVEEQVDKIRLCKYMCVDSYNSCLTYDDRMDTFEELTAMLGDEQAPREGFHDWRGTGVTGLRPLVVKFFVLVHEMAQMRLLLEELETPEGRKVKGREKLLDGNRGRWGLIWNGVDVVLKVLHCLDFLRTCRELCNWYGRTFLWTANPLMLPFSMELAEEALSMRDKIREQLATIPHARPACTMGGKGFSLVSVAPGTVTPANLEWKQEKYLNKWRIAFDELAERRGFNWPRAPDLKDDVVRTDTYTAMLVIYIRCRESVASSYTWEKKFVALLSTLRGAKLMDGKSGLKPDLQLQLPEEILIRAKQALKDAEAALEAARAAAAAAAERAALGLVDEESTLAELSLAELSALANAHHAAFKKVEEAEKVLSAFEKQALASQRLHTRLPPRPPREAVFPKKLVPIVKRPESPSSEPEVNPYVDENGQPRELTLEDLAAITKANMVKLAKKAKMEAKKAAIEAAAAGAAAIKAGKGKKKGNRGSSSQSSSAKSHTGNGTAAAAVSSSVGGGGGKKGVDKDKESEASASDKEDGGKKKRPMSRESGMLKELLGDKRSGAALTPKEVIAASASATRVVSRIAAVKDGTKLTKRKGADAVPLSQEQHTKLPLPKNRRLSPIKEKEKKAR